MLLQQLINPLHSLHKIKTTDSVKVSYGYGKPPHSETGQFEKIRTSWLEVLYVQNSSCNFFTAVLNVVMIRYKHFIFLTFYVYF
jgi:hypothetical protein